MSEDKKDKKIRALKAEGKSIPEIMELTKSTRYKVRKALQDPNRGGAVSNSLSHIARQKENNKPFHPDATRADFINDLLDVQGRDQWRHITQNIYFNEGKYRLEDWIRCFGDFEEFRRQAGLQPLRDQHKIQREIAKHAHLDTYRRFMDVEILPYTMCYEKEGENGKKIKTLVIGSDFHDFHADRFALAVFLDTCYRLQPDIIILNGDIFDLYEFNRYDIDVRLADLKRAFDFVREEIFKPLRELCPDAQIDFILGNHEWRLFKVMANSHPYLKTLFADVLGIRMKDLFGLDEYQINMICKWDLAANRAQEVEKELARNYKTYFGCFTAVHKPPQNPAKKYAMSGTSGHTHRPEFVTFNNTHGQHGWMTTGCIAQVDAEYIEDLDQAQNGFGICHIDTETKVVVQEPIHIGKNFAAVAGKMYYRKPGHEAA